MVDGHVARGHELEVLLHLAQPRAQALQPRVHAPHLRGQRPDARVLYIPQQVLHACRVLRFVRVTDSTSEETAESPSAELSGALHTPQLVLHACRDVFSVARMYVEAPNLLAIGMGVRHIPQQVLQTSRA